MDIILSVLILVIGFAILIKGADWLIDGAVALSERFGISPLIIGLTVVAMGTSAPEVSASITAAATGSGNLSIGNVYGSNIANLALVGGLCALIRPIIVSKSVLKREMPIMILVALLLWPLLHDLKLTRPDSIILLSLFAGMLIYTIIYALKQSKSTTKEAIELEKEITSSVKQIEMSIPKSLLVIGLGLICLAVGAAMAVESSKYLGKKIGLSEAVIGITIVAIGTSLPELITCLVAAFKRQDDISVGNLVGSNVFNTMLVIGAAGMTRPFEVQDRFIKFDFWCMIGISVMFFVFALKGKKISRLSGFILSSAYIAYMVYLFSNPQDIPDY